jgi:hypothetical protein
VGRAARRDTIELSRLRWHRYGCPYRKPKTVGQLVAAAMEKRSKQQYAPR